MYTVCVSMILYVLVRVVVVVDTYMYVCVLAFCVIK